MAELPDIPALAEFLPGYEASGWLGVGAPKGTAMEVIERLHEKINAAIVDADTKARLIALGFEPMPMTIGEFSQFLAEDVDKCAKVIRAAGINPE